MIKNEEKIIERCLKNALFVCDAICVTDTGSTDNTCNKVIDIFNTLTVPTKLYKNEWKNFGYNRTKAFENTVEFCKTLEWNLDTTYGLLLDADMLLNVKDFKKEMLNNYDNFNVLQGNDNFYYQNVRIVRNNGLYSYAGVTHEYINTPPNSRYRLI
jgi:glycosyltransferase involved in cell wall biosynthesis